jgi:hypothetical protein
MSVQAQVPLIPGLTILPLRPADLATASPGPVPWLWYGYLAQGKVTALVSQSKSGTTALVAQLLARMAQGGQLAGLAVRPGRALVVFEEATSDWDPRCRRLAIGPRVHRAREGRQDNKWIGLRAHDSHPPSRPARGTGGTARQ